MVTRFDGGVYIVGGPVAASYVSFEAAPIAGRKGKEKHWAYWFQSSDSAEVDREPGILLNLIKNNNLQLPLLNTNVDFLVGNGVGIFRRDFSSGKSKLVPALNPEIEAWLDRNDVDDIMDKLATDFFYLGNFFLEGRLQGDRRVYSVKHQHATDVRAELINQRTGKIEHYYLGDFLSGKAKYVEGNPERSTVQRVRSFNAIYPPAKFIWHGRKYFPGQKYYGIPSWWGVKTWIRLANQIPIFHLSGLTKGYNIRWHIKIPLSYFDQFPPGEKSAREEELMVQLDQLLSGAENHGKAFISRFQDGKYPEWKIEPLKGELYDEAYRDTYQQSNTALSSANGVDPSLAGYDTTGKLSSGSEKKNSYNIHVALKTPRPRKILLSWLYDVARLNRWDPTIEFGFKDFEITTLDENPTGVQNVIAGP
ncbi:hypothetical protein [Chitinophaga rhizosphaerae]|uniref:hypothetical protein n=1 Tax=Chitinophaga rhizosphaerae TaxID=1864947 RepID=UPI000F802A9B|nr:hypothetical protein [Chitinophaga rhizosphaerae]